MLPVNKGPTRAVSSQLVAAADAVKATQLIIGQPQMAGWKLYAQRRMIRGLLRSARHMDVLVVADYDPHV